MGLTHDFYLVDNEITWENIPEEAIMTKVPDNFFISIQDYLRWVNTERDDGKVEKGFFYYGISIVKETELEKFLSILDSLILLYNHSSEDFYLTGFYLPDENRYEENYFQKKEVLNILNSLRAIANEAITRKKKIIHMGI
ncbi:hypothetical protein K7P65_002526 [Enterococcus faecalis]|uniref:hypothetical protein n=1 Tax=Enterococcus faecalis TaxID=1351 RepID=UPI00115D8F50|nr:hypothetical protein [Enterococcus faecalis]EGO5829926.1 hypothetical protein [Enterococcus faecalis]EHU9649349.1 hypothetical protein [Enterococcus faecalis]EIA6405369.1 hypothetical protein [Enterococcus faecalis]EIA6414927.1 hypothetical protein [Enterococcus faecalis]EIA6916423.1 hypothetical protein [Enterococcus faecalis]